MFSSHTHIITKISDHDSLIALVEMPDIIHSMRVGTNGDLFLMYPNKIVKVTPGGKTSIIVVPCCRDIRYVNIDYDIYGGAVPNDTIYTTEFVCTACTDGKTELHVNSTNQSGNFVVRKNINNCSTILSFPAKSMDGEVYFRPTESFFQAPPLLGTSHVGQLAMYYNHTIHIFEEDGSLDNTMKVKTSFIYKQLECFLLLDPVDFCITTNGHIFVLDTEGDLYQADVRGHNAIWQNINRTRTIAYEVATITMDRSDNLYFKKDRFIYKLDTNIEQSQPIRLSDSMCSGSFDPIAVDETGAYYIRDNSVHKIFFEGIQWKKGLVCFL